MPQPNMKAPPAPYIEIEGAWKMTKMENVEATDVFVIVYLSYMVFILKLMFYKNVIIHRNLLNLFALSQLFSQMNIFFSYEHFSTS
jgi:hypothetical protein